MPGSIWKWLQIYRDHTAKLGGVRLTDGDLEFLEEHVDEDPPEKRLGIGCPIKAAERDILYQWIDGPAQ